MKAVDHAAERLASLKSNPYNDAVSSLALRLLSSGCGLLIAIPQTAKLDRNFNMERSCRCAGLRRRPVGISHAIGHALGGHCAGAAWRDILP